VKLSQVLAAVVTFLVAMWALSWVAKRAVMPASEDPAEVSQAAHSHEHAEDGEEANAHVHSENPFTLNADGPVPKVEVNADHHFGRMAMGATGKHDFLVRNVGKAPLKLAQGPTQCKCTIAGVEQQEIPPGGETTIHLEWKPTETGLFHQGATIWTNDPENSELRLNVEGDVVADVTVEPQNNWVLGNIRVNQEHPFEGRIHSALFEDFEITDIQVSSEQLEVRAIPFSEEEKRIHNALHGFRLEGVFRASEQAGRVQETVTVRTSLEDYAEFEFTVTGNQSGPIVIIGPDWYAGRHLLRLGSIRAEEGKTHRLTFMVEPFGEELEITEVQARPGFVKVTLEKDPERSTPQRERYAFTLEIPSGSPHGIWQAQAPGELILKTNHPRQPELQINLQMEVRP
jgi:hypothetical protein